MSLVDTFFYCQFIFEGILACFYAVHMDVNIDEFFLFNFVRLSYGEGGWDGWNAQISTRGGANVFIRNYDLCPGADIGNGRFVSKLASYTNSY
jgi:hypothetical protein